jgi:hypothetical protein
LKCSERDPPPLMPRAAPVASTYRFTEEAFQKVGLYMAMELGANTDPYDTKAVTVG